MNESDRSRWVLEAARDLAPAVLERLAFVGDDDIDFAARQSVALASGIYRHATIPRELHDMEDYE